MALVKSGLSRKQINILLLGETGAGKSTFINAFANYLNFADLSSAESAQPISLIPTSFICKGKTIKFADDANENIGILGQSATQACRDYTFPFAAGATVINLIDTPGIGDTRGFEQDKRNVANILEFIGSHEQLHAICILLKPNITRLTPSFEFVITQLLSQLEKSASANIIFLYTNARSSFYDSGDTGPIVEELLSRVKLLTSVHIEHDKAKNIFCLDNEAFRFLLAIQAGVRFNEMERAVYAGSWKISVDECVRLMTYICGSPTCPGLIPHRTRDTLSINEARRMIGVLRKPAQEIVENIQLNVSSLETRTAEFQSFKGNIEDYEAKLSTPIVEFNSRELTEPQTVCTSVSCRQYVKLSNGQHILAYPQKCCDPCFPVEKSSFWGLGRFLQSTFDTLGALYLCQVFDKSGTCTKCGCGFSQHMHIYYDNTVLEREDESLKSKLHAAKDEKSKREILMMELETKKKELEDIRSKVVCTTATFAHFLKTHAIIPYNDQFEPYVKQQIENERSKPCKDELKEKNIQVLESLLDQYHKEKAHWEESLSKQTAVGDGNKVGKEITAEMIFHLIEQLYLLPIYGDKIKANSKIEDTASAKEAHGNTSGASDGGKKSLGDKIVAVGSSVFTSLAKRLNL